MIRLFLCCSLLICAAVYSYGQTDSNNNFEQTDKGSHLAGGTINFNNTFSSSSQLPNFFSASLNPNYGYFFANNLAIGGILSLTYGTESSKSTQQFSLSPFVRYYIGPPKAFMVFAYGSAGGGQRYNSELKKVGSYNFGIGPGADYFVNKHVAFEALLTYNGYKLNNSGLPNYNGYTGGINLLFGLQVFF